MYPDKVFYEPAILIYELGKQLKEKLADNWMDLYTRLIEQLSGGLSQKAKDQLFIEIIFMTYSYVHRAINREAFPNAAELSRSH